MESYFLCICLADAGDADRLPPPIPWISMVYPSSHWQMRGTLMDWKRHRGLAVALAVVAAIGVFAARRTSVEPQATLPAAADSARAAHTALMALPEVAAWRGEASAQGVVAAVPLDGEARTVDGRAYRPWRVQREQAGATQALQDFYVTDDGTRILVAHGATGRALTLDEWRVKREAARAAESKLKPLPPVPPVSG